MFNKKFAYSFPASQCRWWYSWNLFWWKVEGLDALNGLNVYHPRDENNIGFVLKLGEFKFRARWSKRVKKFYWGMK
jgi:hypothetical protein